MGENHHRLNAKLRGGSEGVLARACALVSARRVKGGVAAVSVSSSFRRSRSERSSGRENRAALGRERERERVELDLDRGRGTFFSLLGEGLSPLILVSVSLSRGE